MKSAVKKIFSLVLAAMCLISAGKVLIQWSTQDEGDAS